MSDTIFGKINSPLAHFYLIEGDKETVVPIIYSEFEARNIPTTANPDVVTMEYMSFTVGDATALRQQSSQKGIMTQGIFYIISAQAITREAEQTLLKVLEEPAPETHFIFIIRSLGHIADTIKSRAQIHKIKSIKKINDNLLQVDTFIKLSLPERLALVTKFIKSHEDDESTGALRDEIFVFLSELERPLGEMLSKDRPPAGGDIAPILHYIYDAKRYLGLRGMSMKILLEYLALILPVGK